MRRNKIYRTLSEFRTEVEQGRVYEGYVIGYGYAYYDSIAIKPPHLLMDDSICPRRVPNDMSFHRMMWQQELDPSRKSVMESFGDNTEYLLRLLTREQNGMQQIKLGFGEILEVPMENTTTISVNLNDAGKFTLHVKSSSPQGSMIERTVTLDMKDFHAIFVEPPGTGVSWSGLAGATWGVTQSFSGALGGGATKILNNRGAYLPRGEVFKTDMPITVRTAVGNIDMPSKALNGMRVAGKATGVLGAAITINEIRKDYKDGEYYSAGARAAVWGAAAGAAAFIPVVGWGVALGIGVADAIWGERFYEWVEKELGE